MHPDAKEPREKAQSQKIQGRRGTGRRRIPLERIERLQPRRVCFAKRRQTLFRKCMELCQLFPGYEIAAVAFSPDVGTPFEFAGPSTSAPPAELLRRFLSERTVLPPVLSPRADPEEGPALASADGPLMGALDVVSSSPDDDVRVQAPMEEEKEEMTELEAALCWADSILQVGDEADCCGADDAAAA